jgi:hypothetical protein
VTVYGATQDAQKGELLSELVRMCEDDSLPMLVGKGGGGTGTLTLFVGKRKKTMITLMLDGLSFSMQSSKV